MPDHIAQSLGASEVNKFVCLELNLLLYIGILPEDVFEGVELDFRPAPVFDSTSDKISYRQVLLIRGANVIATARFAIDPVFGALLLSVGLGDHSKDPGSLNFSVDAAVRLVAYGYPRIAFEITTSEGDKVFEFPEGNKLSAFNKENQYFLGSLEGILSESEVERRVERFWRRIQFWKDILKKQSNLAGKELVLRRSLFEGVFLVCGLRCADVRGRVELTQGLISQINDVWCVPASVQMIFRFYGYRYESFEVAKLLDQGLQLNPLDLSLGLEHNIVTAFEAGSRRALQGGMNAYPNWEEIEGEIDGGRPMLGLLLGHARVVVGYSMATVGAVNGGEEIEILGLRVLDPWPVNQGEVVLWENFDGNLYRIMCSAKIARLTTVELGVGELVKLRALRFLKLSQDEDLKTMGSVVGVQQLDGSDDGWFAGVALKELVVGFIRLTSDLEGMNYYWLKIPEFNQAGVTIQWLDPLDAEAEAMDLAEPGESLGKPRLALSKSEEMIGWSIEAKKVSGDRRKIEVKRRKFKTT